MATRARGAIGSGVLGNVAQDIVRRAGCPGPPGRSPLHDCRPPARARSSSRTTVPPRPTRCSRRRAPGRTPATSRWSSSTCASPLDSATTGPPGRGARGRLPPPRTERSARGGGGVVRRRRDPRPRPRARRVARRGRDAWAHRCRRGVDGEGGVMGHAREPVSGARGAAADPQRLSRSTTPSTSPCSAKSTATSVGPRPRCAAHSARRSAQDRRVHPASGHRFGGRDPVVELEHRRAVGAAVGRHDDGRSRSRGRRNVNGVSCTSPVNAFGSVGGSSPFSSDTSRRVPASIISPRVGRGAPGSSREQLRLEPGVAQHVADGRGRHVVLDHHHQHLARMRIEERAHHLHLVEHPHRADLAEHVTQVHVVRRAGRWCAEALVDQLRAAHALRGSSAAWPSGPERSVYTRPPRGVPKKASIWNPRMPCSSCARIDRRWLGGTNPFAVDAIELWVVANATSPRRRAQRSASPLHFGVDAALAPGAASANENDRARTGHDTACERRGTGGQLGGSSSSRR